MTLKGSSLSIAAAAALVALTVSSASAHYDPDFVPDLPGAGDPRGVYGERPDVEINGGRVYTFGRGLISVAVECDSSTDRPCSGTVELIDRDGRRMTAEFEADDEQAGGAVFALSQRQLRLAGRRGGLKIDASATATDSLGRSGNDSSLLKILSRR